MSRRMGRWLGVVSSTPFLIGCAAIFAISLGWRAVRPQGEWREELEGHRLGAVELVDHEGNEFTLPHPSVIYFYTEDCEPCRVTGEILRNYPRTSRIPVFAITREGGLPSSVVESLSSTVRMVRLRQLTPAMNIVSDVPLLVRTDASGAIQNAWVGVPDDTRLATLLGPS